MCPEEGITAYKELMAVGKNGSEPHSEDVLTPNTAMQQRKSLLAEQLPGKTQVALKSPLLGKGIKANGFAGGSTSDTLLDFQFMPR